MTSSFKRFQYLDEWMSSSHTDEKTSFEGFVKDKQKYKQTKAELSIMTRNQFMQAYEHELGYDCGYIITEDKNKSWYQLYLLTDTSMDKHHTMDASMRKKYRKCGKERRCRLDEKYSYEDRPLNRVHAYIAVEHSPGESDDKTLAINIICSSNYSDIKGVGSYMMKTLITMARLVGYKNIVLEVGSDQMEEKMVTNESLEECDEESSEESDEEESDDEEYSDQEYDEEEYDEYDEYEQLREDFSDYMSEILWKKSVRHNNGIPYYSFGEQYLKEIIIDNLENEQCERTIPTIKPLNDEEYGYGGYYYNKAKRHSKVLLNYYNRWGFIEDKQVHTDWKCFSELAFPSLRLEL